MSRTFALAGGRLRPRWLIRCRQGSTTGRKGKPPMMGRAGTVGAVVVAAVAVALALVVGLSGVARAQEGGFVVPVATESYEVPITVGGEVVTVTVAVKGSNVVRVSVAGEVAGEAVRAGRAQRVAQDAPPARPRPATLAAMVDVPEYPAGEKGIVDVVSVGPYSVSSGNTSVGVVLRNNTAKTIYDASLEAEAYDAEGNLLGFGDNVFVLFPRATEPGQVSVGSLYFDGMEVTEQDTIEVTVNYHGASDGFREYPLAIDEWGRSARTAESIIGVISNPNEVAVKVFRINLLCFDAETGETQTTSGETNAEVLEPGETAPFQVVSDCESFILSSSGFKE